ncbi:hypothetical protein FQR65_LT20889 [Abscondita terminalis]|nr:hypothetical protein FQR65_LT20889 [Abscondita terminalis]
MAHYDSAAVAQLSDWPFFGTLGERSYGTTLFGDPKSGAANWNTRACPAQAPPGVARAAALGASLAAPLYARRCLYRRGQQGDQGCPGWADLPALHLSGIHDDAPGHKSPDIRNSSEFLWEDGGQEEFWFCELGRIFWSRTSAT